MNRDPLLLSLTLAAGCVDAAGFVAANVFPANMTGNTVVLALAIARFGVDNPGLAAGVLFTFCLGAFAGAWWLRESRERWSGKVRVALFAVGALLLASGVAIESVAPAPYLTLLTAMAMGIQAVAVAQVGVAGVSSVVVTGTLTTVIRRWAGSHKPQKRESHNWLPAASWVAYFAGALIGGVLDRFIGPAWPVYFSGALVAVTAFGLGNLADDEPTPAGPSRSGRA